MFIELSLSATDMVALINIHNITYVADNAEGCTEIWLVDSPEHSIKVNESYNYVKMLIIKARS